MRVGKNIAFGLATTVGLVVMQNVEAVRSQGAGPPSELTRMKTEYRRPQPQPISNRALVDLGHDLFFEPRISASGKTACASCHIAELGWVVTDARIRYDYGKLTSRKSQPLIGLGYAGSAPVGWDGRSATLEAQANADGTPDAELEKTPKGHTRRAA